MNKRLKQTKTPLRLSDDVQVWMLTLSSPSYVGKDIFISHAASDKQLVDLFVNLLLLGCGIERRRVFYTSNSDQGVPPGKALTEIIKHALQECKVGISIITPNSNKSAFCISERGAMWAMGKRSIFMITEPLTFEEIKSPIGEQKILRLMNSRELDTMRDVLVDALGLQRLSTGDWSAARDDFIRAADLILLKHNTERKSGEAAIAAGLPLTLPSVVDLLSNPPATICAIVFDIDKMEQINRSHGHAVGSLLLHEVGVVFKELVRQHSEALMARRCGDDTFFVIFGGKESEAYSFAEKVLHLIKRIPLNIRRGDIMVTASAGITQVEPHHNALESLQRAYFACAEARNKGGNSVGVNRGPERLPWS